MRSVHNGTWGWSVVLGELQWHQVVSPSIGTFKFVFRIHNPCFFRCWDRRKPGHTAMVQNFCKNTMPFASLNMLPGGYNPTWFVKCRHSFHFHFFGLVKSRHIAMMSFRSVQLLSFSCNNSSEFNRFKWMKSSRKEINGFDTMDLHWQAAGWWNTIYRYILHPRWVDQMLTWVIKFGLLVAAATLRWRWTMVGGSGSCRLMWYFFNRYWLVSIIRLIQFMLYNMLGW